MTTMLGTVVLIVIPALLVHRMLAFHHNLVILFERSLAEIARLGYGFALETHLAASILDHIPAFKETVSDIGFQELEHKPYHQEKDQGNHDADGDELNHRTITNDDRTVDRTE
jgi:hypothetical protein